MITPERIRQMKDNFWAETNDPTTEEWREDLTDEELALVARWDDEWDSSVAKAIADAGITIVMSQ
ncbi:hypothetical protein ACTQ33_04115 [Candidatus Avoscillospira sp. LCP25S3_F1]|uniref:hypothetical protein n=1 Tax=Candidatus Avoscillospira sp. LCP25S3_F1 TaxID=3438825 RepID=UPI003F90FBFD